MLKTINEQLADLRAMSVDDIDLSDIPDTGQLDWSQGVTGRFFRLGESIAVIDDSSKDFSTYGKVKHE